jgi:hypothetical protein
MMCVVLGGVASAGFAYFMFRWQTQFEVPRAQCPHCRTLNDARDWVCESCEGRQFTCKLSRGTELPFWTCDSCRSLFSNFDCKRCDASLQTLFVR